MHTSYLPTGQRSRLKKVIQMQISSDINPRRRRDNQFFLSCFTRSASSFIFIYFTFLGFGFAFSRGVPRSFTHILKSFFFVKKIPLSRRVGYVMGGWISEWISERCMYVTPISLDLPLETNHISFSKGKWYVRRFDPETGRNS